MPKKFIILSTLILLGSFSALPANATSEWTYYEVLEESNKFIEHRSMCDGNRECENYLETAYTLAGGKYSAGKSFADTYFMITAIDPNSSTIKVLFNNQVAARWMGSGGQDVFKNLYLFWWENGQPQFHRETFTGADNNPNRHEIYTRLASENEDWLPGNQEVEIPISKEAIEILKITPIYWGAQSQLSDAYSVRHFEDCLKNVGEGYECRATFDWLGNITYRPTEIKQKTPAPAPIEATTTEKISTSVIRVPEIVTEVITVDTPATEGTVATNSPEENINITKETPEVPEVPLVAKEEHQFPWWLVVFIFSGIFLVLWWFIPSKERKKV